VTGSGAPPGDFSIIPYCGPGATPGSLWAAWNFDGWLLAVLACAIAAYLGARHARRGPDAGADEAFAAASLALGIAFVSPLCALSAALFSARVAHHILLVAVAAPLLAVACRGLPGVRSVSGRLLIPAACLHVILFWTWHAPAPYAAALAGHGAYWLMELTLLASAILFWVSAFDRRVSATAFAPAVIGVMAQMGLLGALLVFAAQPLYAGHALTTAAWGLTPLEDQQLAGLAMWVPGALPYLVVLLVQTGRWLARQEAEG
jgi:putative membrane protein